jgi:hypothetical protein
LIEINGKGSLPTRSLSAKKLLIDEGAEIQVNPGKPEIICKKSGSRFAL